MWFCERLLLLSSSPVLDLQQSLHRMSAASLPAASPPRSISSSFRLLPVVCPLSFSESSGSREVARRPPLPRWPSNRGNRALRKRPPPLAARREELQGQLDDWRKEYELQSRFQKVQSEHFTALFELSTDEPFARQVVERLEAAYVRAGDALGTYPGKPITVVLYTREQYCEITRLAEWSVAAYDGRIRLPVIPRLRQLDELDRVLSHGTRTLSSPRWAVAMCRPG
jgi:hypothetical protein